MAEKIWRADELEQMSPAAVDAVFDDSIIWDLDDAPDELISRTRARIERRIQETESARPT